MWLLSSGLFFILFSYFVIEINSVYFFFWTDSFSQIPWCFWYSNSNSNSSHRYQPLLFIFTPSLIKKMRKITNGSRARQYRILSKGYTFKIWSKIRCRNQKKRKTSIENTAIRRRCSCIKIVNCKRSKIKRRKSGILFVWVRFNRQLVCSLIHLPESISLHMR